MVTTGSDDSKKSQAYSPFDPASESLTAANRLNRALGLPEKSRDATGRRPDAPPDTPASTPGTAPDTASPTAPSTAPPTDPLTAPDSSPGTTPEIFDPVPPGSANPDPASSAPPDLAEDSLVATSSVPALSSELAESQPIEHQPIGSIWQERRRRVKRTRRTVRHIDPWSVFKVSILLYICLYLAVMLAGVLLWSALQSTGLVEKLEEFIAEVGSYAVWEVDGNVIYERARIIGLVVAAAGVAFNVVLAIIFNLISDLVGGVRMTILEEDTSSPDA